MHFERIPREPPKPFDNQPDRKLVIVRFSCLMKLRIRSMVPRSVRNASNRTTRRRRIFTVMGLLLLLLVITLPGSLVIGSAACVEENGSVARLESVWPLPDITIDNHQAKIHTQGLFVTDKHFVVTGRLDSKTPRRALLLRFSRRHAKAESVDITPNAFGERNSAKDVLDHPGGFDTDDNGHFWIPVSTSNPKGPTVILRVAYDPKRPLSKIRWTEAFVVKDHIGAICHDRNGHLFGANWDTKSIYEWDESGRQISVWSQKDIFPQNRNWQLAIQDWKFLPNQDGMSLVLAGGIDKSTSKQRATIEWLDLKSRQIVRTITLDRLANVSRPVTNEGLAVFGKHLFLLPEDIGRGAKVLEYSLPLP